MRNLKKFLALVLAMVMAFSLMLSASAATFDDKHFSDTDKVTQEFKEAVAVLTGLDVIKGDGDGDIKDIRPGSPITRAEAAALVYRIATGDVNDTQVAMYSDYSNFKDVKPRTANDAGDWFAGYVGYCQNAGIIKGNTPTTFNPYGKVTGYEVLAMILRAVGYGKQNEFTGSTWQVNVASLGKTKHITDSITSSHLNYTLNMNATREIVAELLFRGSLIKQVRWTPGLGYVEYKNGVNDPTSSLAAEVFALNREGWRNGEWGVPELVWTAGLNPTSTPRREVAVLKADPKETFHEEKRECDVAELMGFSGSKDYILFVNNGWDSTAKAAHAVTDKYHVVATDTVTKVGGYGRLTEIYTEADMNEQYPFHNWESYWASESGKIQYAVTAPKDTIVMVDTIVAKVMNKSDVVLDAAGHVITPARLTVALYDGEENKPNTRVISKASSSKDNWEYAIGDVLSLQGLTDAYKTGNEAEAFRTTVLPGTQTTILYEDTDVFEITKMDGVSGKQTLVYWNQNKHQVDGEDKTDDLTLKLDKAGSNVNTTYTWYYDQYGYVQAIDEGAASYGVITSIYAAYKTNDAANTDGTVKAIATVKFANGDTDTVEIDRFLVKGNPTNGTSGTANAPVTTTAGKMIDTTVTVAATSDSNSIELWPMYDTTGQAPLSASTITGLAHGLINASANGYLYLAPAAVSNLNSHKVAANDPHGIMFDNLFKFVKVANDQTVAVEVAGAATGNTNTGIYSDNHSILTDVTNAGKIWKNLSVITTDDDALYGKIWIDNDTMIMVRDPDTETVTTYQGVDNLPANVDLIPSATATTGVGTTQVTKAANMLRNASEIDWADPDGDGRAEVVYVTGRIDGVRTYGLFYTNGNGSQWDGTTATINGWLNGEEKTLTFTDYALFNKIKNAGDYKGHLFAVEEFMGTVTDVFEKKWNAGGSTQSDTTANLLMVSGAAGTPSKVNESGAYAKSGANTKFGPFKTSLGHWTGSTPTWTGTGLFQYGTNSPSGDTSGDVKWGNKYNADTEAVYYQDVTTVAANDHQLVWTPEIVGTTGTVSVLRDADADGAADDLVETYYINPQTKVWGIGNGVALATGWTALEYLNRSVVNDVTIVYDKNTKAVLEIYIATDPNITPSGDPVSDPTVIAGTGLKEGPNTTIINSNAANSVKNALLSAAVIGNQVVFNKGTDKYSDAGPNTIYFPFSVPDTNAATRIANLTVREKNADGTAGKVMHSENSPVTGGTTAGTPWVMYFNINGTDTSVGAVSNGALEVGKTYVFTITLAGVTVSSGEFTVS